MRYLFLIFIVFYPLIYLENDQSDWIYIFDGKTFDGWHQYNSDVIGSQWSIKNGELIFTNNEEKKQDLITVEEFENFKLSIEWNISKGGNSGIFFGVKEFPELDEAYRSGPEIQVLDNENFFTTTKLHRSPSLYDLVGPDKNSVKVNPHGEWNHLLLTIDHKKNLGTVEMNGQFAFTFPLHGPEWDKLVSKSKFRYKDYYVNRGTNNEFLAFGSFRSGKIGLQDHGSDVKFRNIKIKKLLK
tara:strand:- start:1777 stop:2499 length:723 start_codon:yes stop_codon:yes gene_type:complete